MKPLAFDSSYYYFDFFDDLDDYFVDKRGIYSSEFFYTISKLQTHDKISFNSHGLSILQKPLNLNNRPFIPES